MLEIELVKALSEIRKGQAAVAASVAGLTIVVFAPKARIGKDKGRLLGRRPCMGPRRAMESGIVDDPLACQVRSGLPGACSH